MCQILENTKGFAQLGTYDRTCATSIDSDWGICARSSCDDMSCLCTDSQWLVKEIGRCTKEMSEVKPDANEVEMYNNLMAFFASGCGGMFEPVFKEETGSSRSTTSVSGKVLAAVACH